MASGVCAAVDTLLGSLTVPMVFHSTQAVVKGTSAASPLIMT